MSEFKMSDVFNLPVENNADLAGISSDCDGFCYAYAVNIEYQCKAINSYDENQELIKKLTERLDTAEHNCTLRGNHNVSIRAKNSKLTAENKRLIEALVCIKNAKDTYDDTGFEEVLDEIDSAIEAALQEGK